jgi:hypothetical protein
MNWMVPPGTPPPCRVITEAVSVVRPAESDDDTRVTCVDSDWMMDCALETEGHANATAVKKIELQTFTRHAPVYRPVNGARDRRKGSTQTANRGAIFSSAIPKAFHK